MKRISTLWIFLVGFALTSLGADADRIWQPLNGGLKGTPTAMTSAGKFLVTAYQVGDHGAKGNSFLISYWNGSVWANLPVILCDSGSQISALQFYKGDLYVGGKFTRFNTLTDVQNIVRWNTTERRYERLPGMTSSSEKVELIRHLNFYNNLLVVAGRFVNTQVNAANNMAFFNGEKWISSEIKELEPINGQVNTTLVVNNDFYVGGEFTKIGSTRSLFMARFANGDLIEYEWNKVRPFELVNTSFGVVASGALSSNTAPTYFFRIIKDSAYKILDGFSQIKSITNLVSDGKIAFASGEFKFDGEDKTHYLAQYKDEKWQPVAGGLLPSISLIHLGNNDIFYAAGKFENYRSIELNHIARISQVKALSAIKGRVYFDKNNNCEFNPREEGLVDRIIKITPGNLYVRPRLDGTYIVYLEPGEYEVTIFPGVYWSAPGCSSLKKTVKIKEEEIEDHVDFPLVQKSGIKDLSIDLVSSSGARANVNNTQQYFINYENLGSSELVSGQVKLKYDERLNSLIASPPPVKVDGDSAVWDVADLSPGEKGVIKCLFKVDPKAEDDLQLEASIVQPGQEENDNNNTSSLTQHIVEENTDIRKAVNPGEVWGDTAYIGTNAGEIMYHISFANYTQDTIRSIYVIDTISLNATIKSIDDVSFSHSVIDASYPGPAFSNTYILVYKFEDINLPPNPTKNGEIVNDEGHAAFRLVLKNGLNDGTKFTNTATVVFDYDFDKQTNTVFAIVDDNVGTGNVVTVGDDIKVYPNPAHNVIQIAQKSGTEMEAYEILSLTGKKLASGSLDQKTEIDINNLTPGMYLLHLNGERGDVTTRIVKY